MKRLLPLVFLLAAGCSSADTSADISTDKTTPTAATTATTCAEIAEPITASAGTQIRVYFTVPGFNPKSKECWAKLRAVAKEDAEAGASKKIIAFIDAETFTPGKDGMYDNDNKVRDKVIAQVLVNNDAGLYEFTPDPFAGGKYVEPK